MLNSHVALLTRREPSPELSDAGYGHLGDHYVVGVAPSNPRAIAELHPKGVGVPCDSEFLRRAALLLRGERPVLCSDGLHAFVSSHHATEILDGKRQPARPGQIFLTRRKNLG